MDLDGFESEVASALLLLPRDLLPDLEWPDLELEPEPEMALELEPEELRDTSGGASAAGLLPFACCLESFLR